MNKHPEVIDVSKQFFGAALPFSLFGIIVALLSLVKYERVSLPAKAALNEMLAPNALALSAILALASIGLISAILGSPKRSWGARRKWWFSIFSSFPAQFVAGFAGSIAWFYAGILVVAGWWFSCEQILVMLIFLGSLGIFGWLAGLYLYVLHQLDTEITKEGRFWKMLGNGRVVGFILIGAAICLLLLLPALPAER